MGPVSRSGILGLPNWVLDFLRGLRASAEVLGAGTEVLVANRFPVGVEAGGRSPGRSLDLTNQGLTGACRIHAVIGRHRPFLGCVDSLSAVCIYKIT